MDSSISSVFVKLLIPALLLVIQLPTAWNAPSPTPNIGSNLKDCPRAENIVSRQVTPEVTEQLTKTCANSSNTLCQMLDFSIQVLCAAPTRASNVPYDSEKYSKETVCSQIQSLLEYNGILSEHPELLVLFQTSPNNLVTSCDKQCNSTLLVCSLITVVNQQAINSSAIEFRGTSLEANPSPLGNLNVNQQKDKNGEKPIEAAMKENLEYADQYPNIQKKPTLTGDMDHAVDAAITSNQKFNTSMYGNDIKPVKQSNLITEVSSPVKQEKEQKIALPSANSSISNEKTAAVAPKESENAKAEAASVSASPKDQAMLKPDMEAIEKKPADVLPAESHLPSMTSDGEQLKIPQVAEKTPEKTSIEGLTDDNGTGIVPLDVSNSMEEPNIKVVGGVKTEKTESEDGDFGKTLNDYSSGRDDEKQIRIRPGVEPDSGYFSYFILFLAVCAILFILVQNKKRILAMLIEGRKPRHARRRSTSGTYRKLENNFD